MSLDVYLEGDGEERDCYCDKCDNQHKYNRAETFYTANITHNLGQMAEAAGIYGALWRPDEIGITKAGQLIEPLSAGLMALEADPVRFQQFNAPNGWGLYEHFVSFVRNYLLACRRYPNANVRVWR